MTALSELISVSNLKASVGGRTLFSKLDLSVRQGQTWAILGPNGAGKTTLLSMLAALERPYSGNVYYDGCLSETLSLRQQAQFRAFLPQSEQSLASTVFESVLAGRYPYMSLSHRLAWCDIKAVMRALKAFELSKMKWHDTSVLSSGEKQRVRLASVFAQTPSVFLLDEPLSFLDIRYQYFLLRQLKYQTAQNKAVFMVMHDIKLAEQWSTHVLLMHRTGEVIWGPTEEMMTEYYLSRLFNCPIYL